MKRERFLCGICIHTKYDDALGVKLTEVGPREKGVCYECGKKRYGARCLIESVKKKKPTK